MATYICFDKDNCILPSFVKKNLAGQNRSTKMTTTRPQKLLDAEIQGINGDFEMPALLEEPIEFKATTAPLQLQNTEEMYQKKAEKKIPQLSRQQHLKCKNQQKKPQGVEKRQKLPSLIHGPQVTMQLVPHIFHTDYAWWNGAIVPAHHHVTFVPVYSYST